MKKLLIFLFAFTCVLNFKLSAQVNLVLNPSFEIYDTCPYDWNQIQLAYYWSPIDTTGTPFGITPLGCPELISTCGQDSIERFASAPRNDYFYHYPHTGNGMAQAIMYFDESFEYPYRRDYTQGRLSSPLEAGVSYCVTFYVALEQASGYAINHIGAYFDNANIDSGLDTNCCPSIGTYSGYYDTNSAQPIPGIIPQILDTAILIDTLGWGAVDTAVYDHRWFKIQGSFTPTDGSMNFITIGNFFDAAHTSTIAINARWPGGGIAHITWYLIDDVSVVRSDAHADAGRDTFTSPGIPVWVGNDTSAVGGGAGMPCWWYVLGSTTAIDSGGRIMVNPDTTTTYVEMMNLCGNVTYDTVVVNVWPLATSPGPSKGGEVLVYPNPAGSSITITNTVNITSIEISNIYGQVVLKLSCNNTKVDVDISALISGLYFVKINGLYVKQILKE